MITVITKKIFLIFFGIFCFSGILYAQQQSISIELEADKTQVTIGETLQIVVRMKHASTHGLNVGNMRIPGLENFQQISSSSSTSVQIINGMTAAISENRKVLVAKKTGDFQIGPITMVNPKSQQKIQSNSLNITVNHTSSSSNSNEKDSNTQVKQKKSKSNFFFLEKIFKWIVGILFMGAAYYLYLYSQKQEREKKKAALDHFAKEDFSNNINLPDSSDDDFYEKAKESLLFYLEKKHQISTYHQTTEEILDLLKEKNIFNFELIKKTLQDCDSGRFSKKSADKDIILESLENIIK